MKKNRLSGYPRKIFHQILYILVMRIIHKQKNR